MAEIAVPGQTLQDSKQLDPNMGLDTIQATMDKFLSAADVQAVYGPPVTHGENIVITAAEVLSIAGFGLGSGSGSPGGDHPEQTGSGSGGGGGGRVLARPVAAIVMSPTGVRIEPIVDVTKIVLAVFTTLGFMVAMLNQMRSKKPPKLDV